MKRLICTYTETPEARHVVGFYSFYHQRIDGVEPFGFDCHIDIDIDRSILYQHGLVP